MARRHEEFLSKELEAQRSTSSRRLNELQAQSNSEMLSMRAEINSLSLRCEELSTGAQTPRSSLPQNLKP